MQTKPIQASEGLHHKNSNSSIVAAAINNKRNNDSKVSRVKLRLTKAEIEEFKLSSSFEADEIELIRDCFEAMQVDPSECGKVNFHEFCRFLKLKEEHLLARKLFEKLDSSRDHLLNFFDLLNSLDGSHQKEFKSRLKFYFELFCEQDKKIIASKLLKMQREIGDMFPHVVLPPDYWLSKSSKPMTPKGAGPAFGSRRGSASANKDEEASLKLFGNELEPQQDAEEIGLDEFYDHIDKVYGALS